MRVHVKLKTPIQREAAGRALHKTAPGRTVVELVSIGDGTVFQRELVKCGKAKCKKCRKRPAHGPYWYAYQWREGKTVSRYVGKIAPWEKGDERGVMQ